VITNGKRLHPALVGLHAENTRHFDQIPYLFAQKKIKTQIEEGEKGLMNVQNAQDQRRLR
jgi:hypothetical protein